VLRSGNGTGYTSKDTQAVLKQAGGVGHVSVAFNRWPEPDDTAVLVLPFTFQLFT